jgi:phosphatidylserine decarboxylase
MSQAAHGPADPLGFARIFKCQPEEPRYGFTSWDDFFTRQFRDGLRPVASPDDDSVITNACESAPYHMVKGVDRCARFWIKGQPYSLRHMLADDSLVDQFEGGTVYQAFLNAVSYHRWHSPVNGTVVKAYVHDGSYYSEALINSFASGDPDEGGPNVSQGYLTEVATRAMIFIQADNPAIGLMCVMPVGMAEVSTCQITVYEGQSVKKGDELGMFHFGGSTHCLIFGPHVNLEFDFHGITPGIHADKNIPVNSRIATVL